MPRKPRRKTICRDCAQAPLGSATLARPFGRRSSIVLRGVHVRHCAGAGLQRRALRLRPVDQHAEGSRIGAQENAGVRIGDAVERVERAQERVKLRIGVEGPAVDARRLFARFRLDAAASAVASATRMRASRSASEVISAALRWPSAICAAAAVMRSADMRGDRSVERAHRKREPLDAELVDADAVGIEKLLVELRGEAFLERGDLDAGGIGVHRGSRARSSRPSSRAPSRGRCGSGSPLRSAGCERRANIGAHGRSPPPRARRHRPRPGCAEPSFVPTSWRPLEVVLRRRSTGRTVSKGGGSFHLRPRLDEHAHGSPKRLTTAHRLPSPAPRRRRGAARPNNRRSRTGKEAKDFGLA